MYAARKRRATENVPATHLPRLESVVPIRHSVQQRIPRVQERSLHPRLEGRRVPLAFEGVIVLGRRDAVDSWGEYQEDGDEGSPRGA